MAGHKLNTSVRNEEQLLLFAAYHAALKNPKGNPIRSRNKIVEFNHKLVHRPAAAMANATGEAQEDFEQVGVIGLIRAIELYNPSRGTRFSSYALGFIRGEMLHHVRDNPISSNPRVKRTHKDIYYSIVKLHKEALVSNPDADIHEIAIGLRSAKGRPILTEAEWICLQMAMTAGQVSELNEEIAGEVGEAEIAQLIMSGEISPLRKDCLTEVIVKQSHSIPYMERVSIAAKRLRMSVADVDQYTKMGLNQIAAVYESTISQAEQV